MTRKFSEILPEIISPGESKKDIQQEGEPCMKKGKITTILLLVIFLAGLSLLLYPTVSNFWNSLHQSRAIVDYTQQVEEMGQQEYDDMWAAAEAYNQSLAENPDRFTMSREEKERYKGLLDISDTGMMGYLDIPSIHVSMPIYHTTEEGILQVAAGHLEGSSLPTGGAGTHCVLSGHRGLPSARLFTDLDQMEEGEVFTLRILNRTMTYQVDQILIVDPYDMEPLAIDPDQDYCTLVTCTPYGINTHRLLVRGHRIPNLESEEETPADVEVISGDALVLIGIAAVVLFLLAALLIWKRIHSHKRGKWK